MGRMKKQQLYTRLGPDVVERIVRRFNDGDMTAGDAIASLGISRAQLYNLRTRWLAAGKSASFLGRSGGDHTSDWPKECVDYLETLIQASREDGPNFELYADELARKFGFSRDRSSVRRYCERNLMPLMRSVFPVERKAVGDGYRRWERECYGELYQHDSTPRHIWGAPGDVQSIILTLDDAARQMVAHRICERETLLEHFAMLEPSFLRYGVPESLYTDGFKMFGKEGEDLCSQFGRMCRALDINHMIAPTPQAKGKIERAMRTFQHRLVVVLTAAGVDSPARANEVAGEHIDFWNSTHANEETGEIPDARARRLVESGKSRLRPVTSEKVLRLFMSMHVPRRVELGCRVEFMGRKWKVAKTLKKTVWLAVRNAFRRKASRRGGPFQKRSACESPPTLSRRPACRSETMPSDRTLQTRRTLPKAGHGELLAERRTENTTTARRWQPLARRSPTLRARDCLILLTPKV